MTTNTQEHRPYNVLFLSTRNSTRSLMAEAILARDGADRFRAYSAGSRSRDAVNPMTVKVLESFNYPTDNLRAKSWHDFVGPEAPVMDFVFTVCDVAAGEVPPPWPGTPVTAHWGIEDPSLAIGEDLKREAAFVSAFRYLKNRITVFSALSFENLDHLALKDRVRDIGSLEGASSPDPKVE
jgi:arsenate reductase